MTKPKSIARGCVLFDVPGLTLDALDRERLCHPATGGVVLFAENYQNRYQLTTLVAEIRALRDPPLLVTVDQEGGRVQRFREGFSRLPAARRYGDLYDRNAAEGIRAAGIGGWVMASEIRDVGIDLSFAPVFDVATVESAAIMERAFHQDASVVSVLAQAFAAGMKAADMPTVAKHFPGHGAVVADSHHELPVDSRDLQEINAIDLRPYREAIATDVLDAIMTCHVRFNQIDTEIATFSDRWMKKILREDLNFKGIVFTDDMHMAGAVALGTPAERAERALRAGCDGLLICRDQQAADEMLDAVSALSHLSLDTLATEGDVLAPLSRHPNPIHPSILDKRKWDDALSLLSRLDK